MATTKELTWGVVDTMLRAFGAGNAEIDAVKREVDKFNDTPYGDDIVVKCRARGEGRAYFVRVKDNTWFPDGVVSGRRGTWPTAG